MNLSVKRFINNNIRNYAIFVILVTLILLKSAIQVIPTAINSIFGPFELNYNIAFQKDLNSNAYYSYSSVYKQGIDSFSQDFFNYKNAYKQSGLYEFEIDPIHAYDLGLYYETTTTIKINNLNFDQNTQVSHKYILLDVGKAHILARVEPDFKINDNQKYSGVLIPISTAVRNDVQSVVNQSQLKSNIWGYELDTINSFSNLK